MNAAIFEARDREEREWPGRLAQPQPSGIHPHVSKPSGETKPEPEQAQSEPLVKTRLESGPTLSRDPWAEAKKGSDGPESWTPVVRRK